MGDYGEFTRENISLIHEMAKKLYGVTSFIFRNVILIQGVSKLSLHLRIPNEFLYYVRVFFPLFFFIQHTKSPGGTPGRGYERDGTDNFHPFYNSTTRTEASGFFFCR